VNPKSILTGPNRVTFLIYGANVWRSTEVFLGGLKAEDIQVLPDMEGIAASFTISQLPPRPNASEPVNLIVWTRNGFDTYPIEVKR
jgi:hypothetical protein